jgi:hypothetical protein
MRSPRRRPASAVESYLAYRRDGGENQDVVADLCDRVAQAVAEGDTVEAEQTLAEYLTPNANQRTKTIIPKFQAILAGSRDLAMADDPALNYRDAVEVRLLLERLGAAQL